MKPIANGHKYPRFLYPEKAHKNIQPFLELFKFEKLALLGQHSFGVFYTVDFLEFFKTQGTIGLPVRIVPLINIPKGFSSKMTLEVAKIGLKVSTQYMV